MPYKVNKSNSCPISRPWAVTKDDGKLMGCHSSDEDAKDQVEALYASESSKSMDDLAFNKFRVGRKA